MTATILEGNCLVTLKTVEPKTIQTCVTSPPFFGLRDYGTASWEGGDADCEHSTGNQVQDNKAPGAITSGVRPGSKNDACKKCGAIRIDEQIGLESTPELYVQNLVNVFREVRRVLRDDGTLWLNLGDSYWGGKGQSSQAWSTENQDRETLQKSQHQISGKGETRPTDGKHPVIKPKDLIGIPWMVAFALRADGWYLRSDIIWHKPNPMPESVTDRPTKSHEYIFLLSKSANYYYDADAIAEPTKPESFARANRAVSADHKNLNIPGQTRHSMHEARANGDTYSMPENRNKRSVWTVTTKPYSGAHFATFPPDLIEPCILAGSKAGDIVLDPFNGSGTTGSVALKHHRDYIGCELNPEYIELTHKRFSKTQLAFPT